jgi:outer membrane protein assembly factor BamB
MYTLLFVAMSLNAQLKETWSSSFDTQVNWQIVTSLGNYIVQTDSGLYGIQNDTGEVLWHDPNFTDLSETDFAELNNSPFAKIETTHGLFFINMFDGSTVFNSFDNGIKKVKDHFVLYRSNSIVVSGKSEDKENIAVSVDIESGKVLWKSQEDFGKIVDIVELSDQELLGVTLFKNLRINSLSGEVIWSVANTKESQQLGAMGGMGNLLQKFAETAVNTEDLKLDFAIHPSLEYFVIGTEEVNDNVTISSSSQNQTPSYNSTYRAYSVKSGDLIWKKPVTVKGQLGHSTWVADNLLIMPFGTNNSKVNLIDIKTGQGLWGKKGRGVSIKGGIYSYTPTENGMLVITTRNDKNFLNYLDTQSGTFTFDKTIKVKGYVGYTLTTDNGILYATEREMNIVNTSTGDLLWEKDIKTHYNLVQQKDDHLYLFNNKTGSINALDLNSGQISMSGQTGIDFKEGEGPKQIEVRDSGIVLSSDQNFAMYDFDGKLTYQSYYKSPKEEGWKRALLYAGSIYAGYVSAVSGMASGVMSQAGHQAGYQSAEGQTFAEVGQAYNEMSQAAGGAASMAFGAANKRFKATKESRDYVMVLTKTEEGIELVKMNKDTGESETSIALGRNRKPNYAIDLIEGIVYLEVDNNHIKQYLL